MKKKGGRATSKGKDSVYAVILAGGIGSRFWPLSRESSPKQLLKVAGDESLLKQTIARLSPAIKPDKVLIVTNSRQAEVIRLHLGYALGAPSPEYAIEPVGRNTAPAIALAAKRLIARDPEAVMVVLPSDHLIGDPKAFRDAVSVAIKAAKDGLLVTFGIRPSSPETGYGYIKAGTRAIARFDGQRVLSVDRFVEKPDIKRARRYLKDKSYLWNSGIFVWKASRILDEARELLPQLYSQISAIGDGAIAPDKYEMIEPISIDHGILERAKGVAVIPADFKWSDMGSWSSLNEVFPVDNDGNIIKGRVVDIGSENSLILGCERVVATIGLKDMILVDTPDATLVCPRHRAQEVKDVVGVLKKKGYAVHEQHRTVERPWGSYTVLEEGDAYKIKKITVAPKRRLSLQVHRDRSEHWVVISGKARVQRGEEVVDIGTNQSTYIPKGVKHRLENPLDTALEIIEVQSGERVDEEDIVRFEDDFYRGS